MDDKYKIAKEKLIKYDQQHLLMFYDEINEEEKEKILNQILNIDFEEIIGLYKNSYKEDDYSNVKISPIEHIIRENIDKMHETYYKSIGERVIKNNEFAVATMAGGQGTRLGYKGPKGTYELELEPKKSLFEILCDSLKVVNYLYNISIPWYIMTSENNNQATIDFFEENNYFGYNKDKVKFFKQSNLPLMDTEGKLLINKDFKVKEASDGNGGVFSALVNDGMIDDMKKHNVKWVYICGVDNIMVRPIDSLFLGLAVEKNVKCASKSVVKSYPEEKVGAFCKKNGKPGVVEYIEMTKEMVYGKNEDDELLYGESHIVSNMFTVEAIEKIAKENLEYHVALKKNSYINENGEEIIPEEPNSYKFEAFIFDGFQFFDDLLVMRINRNTEFAPIKNAKGIDSPDSAKEIYEKYYKDWE